MLRRIRLRETERLETSSEPDFTYSSLSIFPISMPRNKDKMTQRLDPAERRRATSVLRPPWPLPRNRTRSTVEFGYHPVCCS
jgi:hypothetical protein